jgi:hypothetical protein
MLGYKEKVPGVASRCETPFISVITSSRLPYVLGVPIFKSVSIFLSSPDDLRISRRKSRSLVRMAAAIIRRM